MQASSPARSVAPSSAAPEKSSPESTPRSIEPSSEGGDSTSPPIPSSPSLEGTTTQAPAVVEVPAGKTVVISAPGEPSAEARTGTAAERTADVFLLMTYGAVIFFFLWRFFRRRRLPSLFIALLPLGWVLVALWDLRIMEPHPTGAFRWAGVMIGALLLWAVVKSEWRQEREAAGLPDREQLPPDRDPGGLS